MREVSDAGLGLDVVDEQHVVGAKRDDVVSGAVDGDAERLPARPVLVDRVDALLSQVIPEPDHARHVYSRPPGPPTRLLMHLAALHTSCYGRFTHATL